MAMKLTFINVGYGESILLQCPSAERGGMFTMLIDGGSAEDAEYAGFPHRVRAADYLRSAGVTRLDVLLNTHIHEDHTSGLLAVAQALTVGEYWCCALPRSARDWPALPDSLVTTPATGKSLKALNDHRLLLARFYALGVPIRSLYQSDKPIPLSDGLTASVIGPSEAAAMAFCDRLSALYRERDPDERKRLLVREDAEMNNHSVMLMLEYFGARILLPGDTNKSGYQHLLRRDLPADVFKVGHHGQRDGADAALLAAIQPRVVAVCASSDRRYESMHPEILSAIAASPNRPLIALSDVPDLPPWTDGVPPHSATEITVTESGRVDVEYR